MKNNHSYPIKFTYVTRFEYEDYEPGIGVKEYKDRIEPFLPSIWEKLNENIHSRQAVITLNRLDFPSCLLSYQVQIVGTEIYVTCNFRSQAAEYRTKDARMICYWTSTILHKLEHLITTVNITCNVGNYHTVTERK